MKNLFKIAVIILVPLLGVSAFAGCTTVTTENPVVSQPQQTVKLSGSGSGYPALKVLAKAYETKVKNIQINFHPGNQTEGGITGAKRGLVDLGIVSRKLKPEEDDGQLVYHEVAQDALFVATHSSVKGVKNLQTKDIKAIYSGEITNWKELGCPDAPIVVLDRPEDESSKRLLRKYYLGKDLKTTPKAVILPQESELITAVQDTPYSIGAFSLAYAIINNLPVNRLSLDGAVPSIENVQAGKYKMVRHIGIVSKKTANATIQGFIDFAISQEGGEALKKSGFIQSSR